MENLGMTTRGVGEFGAARDGIEEGLDEPAKKKGVVQMPLQMQ